MGRKEGERKPQVKRSHFLASVHAPLECLLRGRVISGGSVQRGGTQTQPGCCVEIWGSSDPGDPTTQPLPHSLNLRWVFWVPGRWGDVCTSSSWRPDSSFPSLLGADATQAWSSQGPDNLAKAKECKGRKGKNVLEGDRATCWAKEASNIHLSPLTVLSLKHQNTNQGRINVCV